MNSSTTSNICILRGMYRVDISPTFENLKETLMLAFDELQKIQERNSKENIEMLSENKLGKECAIDYLSDSNISEENKVLFCFRSLEPFIYMNFSPKHYLGPIYEENKPISYCFLKKSATDTGILDQCSLTVVVNDLEFERLFPNKPDLNIGVVSHDTQINPFSKSIRGHSIPFEWINPVHEKNQTIEKIKLTLFNK